MNASEVGQTEPDSKGTKHLFSGGKVENEDEDEHQDKGALTIIGGINCGEGSGKRPWKHAVH